MMDSARWRRLDGGGWPKLWIRALVCISHALLYSHFELYLEVQGSYNQAITVGRNQNRAPSVGCIWLMGTVMAWLQLPWTSK